MFCRLFPCVVLAVGAAAGASSPALAQAPVPPAEGSVEVWGGFAIAGPRADVSLTTSYAPTLRYFVATGQAGQTLQIDGSTATGFEFGANYFPIERAGVQVLVGYDSFDLSGPSGPYTVHLEYTAKYPPGYTDTPVSIDRTQPWPDASGRVRQWSVSVNGVGRWSLGRRVNGELSAGLTYFRLQGSVEPVGYSVFQLGGHSVLFSDLYELAVDLEQASSFGFNAGGAADVRLRPHLSLTADFRYFNGGAISSPVVVTEVLNASEILTVEPTGSIQDTLHPVPLELSPARARIMVGLKAVF